MNWHPLARLTAEGVGAYAFYINYISDSKNITNSRYDSSKNILTTYFPIKFAFNSLNYLVIMDLIFLRLHNINVHLF